jgi:hypothetical protein
LPGSGLLGGGTVVTVKGAGLSDVTACSVGGVAATDLNVLDDGQLQFTTGPAAAEGPADVRCVDPQGAGVLRRAFVYVDAASASPRLLGVSPTHGLAAGGEVVTVVGVGLDAAGLTVKFGGAAATTLSATATTLTVRTPPGAARTTAAVTATGFAGTASFVYNVALRAVRPSHGPPAGGTALELDGDGFGPGLVLTFGGVPATPAVVSASLLSATAPAGAGGAVQVRVADAADPEDQAVLSPGYTYDEPLSVGAVVPTSGAIAGGTYVTVFGAGFAPGIVFHFGASRAKDITVLDSHTATMHTPVGAVGLVDVSAALDGKAATDPSVFTYVDPTNQGGGASGGPLNGTLNVTVLDSTFTQYGAPVSGATVLLGADPSTPFQGRTDARGQITFSDPSLVKAQTVSVSKDGYELVTVAEQASQNMTVYIGQNDANGGSPGQGGGGVTPVTITGKVRGFKAPRPLQPNEHEEARVSVAPHSLFYVDPLGYTSPPSPSERTVLNADGQGYLRVVYPGLYAVYAVYGIVNDDTKVFTPVLMGIHRGIEVNATHPASNEDIVLDMHLDASAPITLLNPLSDPATGAPARNQVWAYLDLGAEGVVPLGGATGLTPDLLYTGLPELDGSNFIFLGLAQVGTGLPESIFFRRQPGDVGLGLTMGPLLGFCTIVTPDALTPTFNGTLEWSFGPGPAPDLTQVQILKITAAGAINLWTVVLPGDNTQISLPPTVMQGLIDREPPGENLEVIITSSRAPRFDYNHWSYGDLGQLNWTAYTENVGVYSLPLAAKP